MSLNERFYTLGGPVLGIFLFIVMVAMVGLFSRIPKSLPDRGVKATAHWTYVATPTPPPAGPKPCMKHGGADTFSSEVDARGRLRTDIPSGLYGVICHDGTIEYWRFQ